MHITFETADQTEAHALIAELDAYLYSLYPAESVYALDVASLCQPEVRFAIVRDHAGAALACGAIVLKSGYGEIKRVYVRPQARAQGVASRLMEALEAKAVASGRNCLMLETGPPQTEALAFYTRLGYRHRGPFGDYPDDPHSIFMQKSVDRPAASPNHSANEHTS